MSPEEALVKERIEDLENQIRELKKKHTTVERHRLIQELRSLLLINKYFLSKLGAYEKGENVYSLRSKR